MSSNHSIDLESKSKSHLAESIIVVPAADNQGPISLRVAGKEADIRRQVTLGNELAQDWLADPKGLRLDQEMARARHVAGEERWPAVEAGFLARIHQRVTSIGVDGPSRTLEKSEQVTNSKLVAIGGEAMKIMHEQICRLVRLVDQREIEAFSQEGLEALNTLKMLSNAIQLVGRVGSPKP